MKSKAGRLVLMGALALAPAFLEGCILTDLLGGLGGAGGGGGLGGLLGAAQGGGLGGQQARATPLAPGALTAPVPRQNPAATAGKPNPI